MDGDGLRTPKITKQMYMYTIIRIVGCVTLHLFQMLYHVLSSTQSSQAKSDTDMGSAFSAPPSIEITMKGFCPISLCVSPHFLALPLS